MSRFGLLLVIILGLGVASQPAHAQVFVGLEQPITQVQAIVDQLVSTQIGGILLQGQAMLQSLAAIMLVYMLILALFSRQAGLEAFVQFVFTYITAYAMLAFYDSPLPWGSGSSFHSIFADEARWIDGTIGLSIVNQLTATLKTIIDSVHAPMGFSIVAMIAYLGLLVDIVIMWIFSFGLTAASYVALSVGAMLGPLLIPFLIWPSMSWLFSGWLRYMLIYSFWRVMASAVIAVFANVDLMFINHYVIGDLSAGHLAAVVPAWTAINVVCLFVLWMSHVLARDLISGSASMGNPFSTIAGAAAAVILK